MTGEMIGNGGCWCVLPFEKHYMKIGLDKLIEEEKEKINKVQEGAEDIKKSGIAEPEVLIDIHKRFMRNVEIVRNRLENTLDCK